MKDFLKFTLATVTGIILSSIVLFIISMVTLLASCLLRTRKQS